MHLLTGSYELPGPQERFEWQCCGNLEERAVAFGWINQEFLLRGAIEKIKEAWTWLEILFRSNFKWWLLLCVFTFLNIFFFSLLKTILSFFYSHFMAIVRLTNSLYYYRFYNNEWLFLELLIISITIILNMITSWVFFNGLKTLVTHWGKVVRHEYG